MLFPGQGSHSINMMSGFENIPIIHNTFDEASSILGYDLFKLIKYGPYKELNKTSKTQPAILVSSIAIYRLWLKKGGNKPNIIAGHSLGEYTALVCANVIDFIDAIKLVQTRGKIMENACKTNKGSMTAIIGLNKDLVFIACQEASDKEIVEPVNFNSSKQIVISGHIEAVKKASLICKTMGAKLILPLSINIPAHSSLMKSASLKLKDEIDKIKFNKPKIPIVNNVNATCEYNPKIIKKSLVCQLYNPVLWLDTINFLINLKKIYYLLEIGPGKVLTNLSKRIAKNKKSISINNENILSMTINKIIEGENK